MANRVNVMSEIEVLNAALAVGWVKFSYYKVDGTKRFAVGTRNLDLIEQIVGKHYESRRAHNYFNNCNGYFDLTRCDWRQFNIDRFIGLEFDKMSNEQAVAVAVSISYGFGDGNLNALMDASLALIGRPLTADIFKYVQSESDRMSIENGEKKAMLIEMGLIGSGINFFPKGKQVKNNRREQLIAELKALRKREEEILAELL